jgi:hypothetical protein
MLEKEVEQYLRECCAQRGWGRYKFTSPARRNVPDDILVVPCDRPGGLTIYVECKRPGGKPTAGQQREHARLRELGAVVYVVDSFEAIDAMLRTVSDKYL